MVSKEEVLKALSVIIDPDLKKDIVTLGFIKELVISGPDVSFEMELTTPACPLKGMFKEEAEKVVKAVPGVGKVHVVMTSRQANAAKRTSGLKQVKSIIAIASCKGGVGKSTVSATTACELAQRGFKVGLLDCDLFGPSVPTLFNIHNQQIKQKDKMLIPIEVANGLKVMSFGFLLGDAPAIMRGPMVSGYIQQLLHSVEWGELDYLFIDMPPGTGDIQLTISQSIELDGAVIITTRASLSLVDVAKGILMFEKVNIPMLGVVENMAYFICDSCDKKHYIFGDQKSALSDRFGLDTLAHIPLDPARSKPFDNYETNEVNKDFVDNLVREIGRMSAAQEKAPEVELTDSKVIFKMENGDVKEVDNLHLRDSCRCALCVDEYTGVKTLKRENISADIKGLEATQLGNYATSIKWNDGHSSSIYPFKKIDEWAKGE